MEKKIIDISFYQGAPDFEKVKTAVDGVIIRAGYGRNNIDTQFVRNISECNRLGIPCGVYWFSYAYTEEMARQEARYCLDAIKPYSVELPVCFDFEYDSVVYAKKQGITVTKELATKLVHAFCGEIERSGRRTLNYTNRDFLSRYYDESTLKYGLWLAEWPKTPPEAGAAPPMACVMWQWGTSNVAGISGAVDTSFLYEAIPSEDILLREENAPSEWAREAVEWAVENGLIQGDGNGNLMLRENVTREQMLVILHRMKKKTEK